MDQKVLCDPIPAAEKKPSRGEAEEAVRTLIRWAGDNPEREGLRETPRRVTDAWTTYFSGYEADPAQILSRTFTEAAGYDEMVALTGIRLESHCEHHLSPIIGTAHVAYLPNNRIVGISKLARLVDAYARRLQIQEAMTAQIADTIQTVLNPKGVAVLIEASHMCLTSRGVHKPGASMVTSRMLGVFRKYTSTRQEFLTLVERARKETAET